MRWLNISAALVDAEDVVDFVETLDKNRDGFIDYKEFMDEFTAATRRRRAKRKVLGEELGNSGNGSDSEEEDAKAADEACSGRRYRNYTVGCR